MVRGRWTGAGGLGAGRSLSRGSMRRHFHKMHGLGNDFVIVDARETPFDVTPALAKAIADRRIGVGCDQLILLEPSATADLKMRIWNSDGGEVESCGNATRCVVRLAGARTIETDGGLLEGYGRGRRGRGRPSAAALCLGRNPARLSDGHLRASDGLGRPRKAVRGQCRQSPRRVSCRRRAGGCARPAWAEDRERSGISRAHQCQRRDLGSRPLEIADLRTRRRRDAGVRDRRLCERDRGHRHQAREIPCARST